MEEFFKKPLEDDFKQVKVRLYKTHEKEHSREDHRWYAICRVSNDAAPRDLPDTERWPNLKVIGIAIHNSNQDGKDCNEVRYFILSNYFAGKTFGDAVMQHWAIENSLDWQLDVTFNEDQSRIRKGHADTNFSILCRSALSMLKNEKTAKVGVKNKRFQAGWDEGYFEKVLLG